MKWLFLFLLSLGSLCARPIEFVIISPSYNNAGVCERSLQSIASQTYPHWSLLYVNDCSTDHTVHLVDTFIRNNHLSHKCKVITNNKRRGAMANWYRAIKSLRPKKIVVCLDGDDHFAHEQVLARLAEVYANKKVWMTYGNYRSDPDTIPSVCEPFSKKAMKKRAFRSLPWAASHLRTFYAGLFQKIRRQSFRHRGKFVPVCCDLAMMFPMLEMASKGHIRFIPEVLYIHNNHTPFNDYKTRLREQLKVDRKIRHKARYKPLKKLF
ncbi:MAG: glycosyltransferase family 2 protein [Verrucomicrobia bacterium]|nr:glycosyltransferase family 2 protein [Verrucomicrobiota bacterium]